MVTVLYKFPDGHEEGFQGGSVPRVGEFVRIEVDEETVRRGRVLPGGIERWLTQRGEEYIEVTLEDAEIQPSKTQKFKPR